MPQKGTKVTEKQRERYKVGRLKYLKENPSELKRIIILAKKIGFQKGNVSCANNRKGCKLTEEHKRKIGLASLGHKLSDESKKKIGDIHRGKIVSIETRLKISKAGHNKKFTEKHKEKLRIARQYRVGKLAPGWQGGKSFEKYDVLFNSQLKEKIRKRDGCRCQKCFKHQNELKTKTGKFYKLVIHHIDYNKKNNNECNLISLCRSCHSHTNFNRKYWKRYFNKKLKKGERLK